MQKTLRRKKTPGGGGGCAWPGYARPGTAPPPPPPGTKTTSSLSTNASRLTRVYVACFVPYYIRYKPYIIRYKTR